MQDPTEITQEEFFDRQRRWEGPLAPQQDPEDEETEGEEVEGPQRGLISRLFRSAVRGTMRGINETTTGLSRDVAAPLASATGLDKLVFDEDGQADFVDWYESKESRVDVINPDRIPDAQEGVLAGLTEGIAQFTVGFLGPGKLVKPLRWGGQAMRAFSGGLTRGAVADASAFDPWEARVGDLVESGPEWLSTPVSRYLMADPEDTAAEGRLKNTLEGAFIGSTLETLVYGLRALKIRKGATEGRTTPEQAEADLESLRTEAEENINTAVESDPVEIIPNEDGSATVRLKEADEDAAREVFGDEAEELREITLSNPEQAERVAASLEQVIRGRRVPETPELTPEQVTDVQTRLLEKLESKDLGQGWEGFGGGLDINFNLTGDFDTQALFNAISEAARPAFRQWANRSREGGGVSNQLTRQEAEKLVGANSDETILRSLMSDVQGTEEMWVRSVAYDGVMQAQAQQTRRWAQSAARGDNPVAVAMWKREVQRATDYEINFSRLQANVGRTLQARNVKTGPLEPGSARSGTQGAAKEGAAPKANRGGRPTRKAKETAEAKTDLEKMIEAARRNPEKFTKGTEGVSAEDFIRSREYQEAEAAIRRAEAARKALEEDIPPEVLAEARRARSERILKESDGAEAKVAEAEALDPSEAAGPPKARNAIEDISRRLENERKLLDETEELRARNQAAKEGAEEGAETTSFNIVRAAREGGETVRDPFEGMSKDQLIALSRSMVLLEDSESFKRAIRGLRDLNTKMNPKDPTYWDHFNTFRTNMMLYGAKTHQINVISTAIMAGVRPIETAVGGVLTGDLKMARFGSDWIRNMADATTLMESLRALRMAWKSGEPVLDSRIHDDNMDGMLQGNPDEAMSVLARGIANAVTLPRRLMVSADEFAKQLTYRGHVYAQAAHKARSMGIDDPQSIAQYAGDTANAAFDGRGGAVNMPALQEARYATFQNDLKRATYFGDRSVGELLQSNAQRSHLVRFIAPFVRTPVNLFRAHADRFPVLGALQKEMVADFRAGGQRQAQAVSKQMTGTAIYAGSYSLFSAGLITGNGPMDPRARKEWLSAGNQPYSVKIGDDWYSYRRLDPFATPLGVVADALTAYEHLDERGAEGLGFAMVAALSSHATSRTYMTGITEILEATASGNPQMFQRVLATSTGSFVPGFIRQTNPDDQWRDARGYVEMVWSQIPGLSETLEPSRNYLGEIDMRPPGAINRSMNVFQRGASPDPLMEELARLGTPIGMPNHRVGQGTRKLDLKSREDWDNGTGQSPWDRWLELTAEGSDAGTLREQLQARVNDPSWETMSGGAPGYPGGLRAEVVRSIIGANRERAWVKVLREYPALREAYQEDILNSGRSMRAVDELLDAAN